MIARYHALTQHPAVFQAVTGVSIAAFDTLAADVAPALAAAERRRLSRPTRQRAIGAGRRFALSGRDQVLLTVVWLRRYPINAVLGFLFGVEETTALRTVHRVLPVLEAAGLDTMRLPDPGKGKRPDLDALLQETPALAVIVDTFEPRVQRPRTRAAADPFSSGKKKAVARRKRTPSRPRWRSMSGTDGSSTCRRVAAVPPPTSLCCGSPGC